MTIDTQTFLALITAALGGGGITAFITALVQNKKVKAEARSIGAKTPAEVESLSVETMGEVIEKVRGDYRAVCEENDSLKQQLQTAYTTIEEMKTKLDELQAHIAQLLKGSDVN